MGNLFLQYCKKVSQQRNQMKSKRREKEKKSGFEFKVTVVSHLVCNERETLEVINSRI